MPTNSSPARYTHTARLLRSYAVGAEQFGRVALAGETVELWKDPALQDGEWITIRRGHEGGAVLLTDLADVAPKPAAS